MIKKIKLFKKVLELKKELKRLEKEEQSTFEEIGLFLQNAKTLSPKIGGILEKIIYIVKSDSNKKV
jgi:hypothetical protein